MAAVNEPSGALDPVPGRPSRLVRAVRALPRLPQRLAELELAVVELRRLERQMAELTDLVAEVLLPATARDDDELRRRLQAYTDTL